MNIFGQGMNTWNNWESQSGKTGAEALKSPNAVSNYPAHAVGNPPSMSSLQVGQVFLGEILNITSKDVTILLDNQQIINAKLGESMELNIGQRMYFEVKDNQEEQVFIRPLQNLNVDGQTMAAEKALTANGFSFTERNLQIANYLMEAGMPLDKESMRKIMQQSVRVPEADIKQLVAMNRLEIPVNEMTVKQFAQYTNNEHQLTQAMNQVLDSLETAIGNMNANGSLEQMQTINQQILDIFGWGSDKSAAGMTDSVMNAAINGENADITGEETGRVLQTKQQLPVSDSNGEQMVGGEQAEGTVSAGSLTNSKLDSTILDSLRTQLREQGLSEEVVQKLTDGKQEYGEMLSNISEYLLKEDTVSKQGLRSFFQSDNYKKLLKKGIQEEWLMKPENMKEPREIDRLYEKIYSQAEKLEESLGHSGQSSQEFSEQAKNMRENIQFMQQLNQQFIFAQLPMKMNGQEANSELFVYANKKKLQQGADGVKVLLHLDMPNLGNTDILIRLKDNMLHARFTLEDQTAVSIVAKNMQELSDKLENKGFHFTNEVLKTIPKQETQPLQSGPPEDAVVDEMFNQDLVTGIKRYSFDMRT